MALSLIIVNPDPAVLAEQLVCFQHEGCAAAGTTSFVDARALIAAFRPDALVTAVRIGEYNGLHLAILARTKHGDLPTIVLGGEDPVLEREAENAGAQYVLSPIHPSELVTVVRRAMAGEVVPRRWPRVRPTGIVAAVAGGQNVSVVDISYGGLGIAVPSSAAAALPREFKVALPELGVTVTAERVWSRAEADHVRYGLRLPTTAADGVSWRAVVEALRGVTANN
jgi:DNA-binding NarL/FixJ family response regulator